MHIRIIHAFIVSADIYNEMQTWLCHHVYTIDIENGLLYVNEVRFGGGGGGSLDSPQLVFLHILE